ncbi:hypothetical protein BDW02DRAFT_49941 [Decorospora gaudefroyi]|uniref:C2H2-type domain-containing protein n=1 Tax=Decorospora gaudefroyi TaxID=184978 RepID=A0A6A5KS34_9PLEO|nr:hypothetical protein BDW02DRAFT_49941 [Decorospora gaudefroyi]
MFYADQPTPPFNSPYQQHASRTNSLGESPYPSPVRQESRSNYPQGLGLYEVQQSMSTGLPPSPQPSETWGGHFSSGASPLMPQQSESLVADPYLSGAFDHPVSRSPIPWNSAQTSPRSSLSSYTREMSTFSHDGSEHTYSGVSSDVHFGTDGRVDMNGLPTSRQPPLTVAPERLSRSMYSYDNAYASPALPRYEPAPVFDYNQRGFERAPSEESIGSPRSGTTRSSFTVMSGRERTRNRRHTDPANAPYRCTLCPDKGFARRYNYNQHMLTHDTYRKRDNVCEFPGCGKEFVRKTDLARHDQSVHKKTKPFQCSRCPSVFARKDTLRRHQEDGCPRRNQVPITDAMVNQMRHDSFSTGVSRI